MIDAHASVTVPVDVEEAFAAVTDLEHADWLPTVRGLRHVGGPRTGLGARYEVEVGLVGRHLQGILVCSDFVPPTSMELVLEDGLDLTITVTLVAVSGGCTLDLEADYSVGGALGGAVERASAGAARREVARAVENFAARFGRKQPSRS
jgi:carbon monoxide dehydrogenase subunit G